MKKIFSIIIFLGLIFIPTSTFSNASDCDAIGTTVIFVNGIFTKETDARTSVIDLERQFLEKGNRDDIKFLLGYNSTHLGGVGDMLKAVLQGYNGAWVDYDLTTLLSQVHEQLQTRKVLLVGHSQGTFYTNAAYEYLISHGVPTESIGVYNVATPADRVAGNGNYLTSSSDKMISSLVADLTKVGNARRPLAPNIDLELSDEEQAKPLGGHGFSRVYLAKAPDRIVGDVQEALGSLFSKEVPLVSDGCFIAPKMGLAYRLQGVAFIVGDATSNALAAVTQTAVAATKYVASKTADSVAVIYRAVKAVSTPNLFVASLATEPSLAVSTDTAGQQESVVTPENDQPQEELATEPSLQDQIDDLLERIDFLRGQITVLSDTPVQNEVFVTPAVAKLTQESIPETVAPQTLALASQQQAPGAGTIYLPVWISEVQIEGITDSKYEFVELYNPNEIDVDLTGWYVQRKTKTGASYSSYAANTLFSGKKIGSGGYFVIARATSPYVPLANVLVDSALTADNSLVLKNPNGQIADKVGWGDAQDYEFSPALAPVAGQSIGRKVVDGKEQDGDKNINDFEANIASPGAKNVKPSEVLVRPPSDTLAPEVIFTVDAIQKSLAFTVDFSITDPLGTVSPSGIDSYLFRWQAQGAANWQEDAWVSVDGAPTTATIQKSITGIDETTYYFQVKTKDLANNESDWQPEILAQTKISTPKKIIINEIQIDSINGSGGTADDWVEMYNPNDVAVDLSGWSIQKHSAAETCSITTSYFKKNFEDGDSIGAHGFFLVANSGATTAITDIADMTTGWSLSDNNTIYLVSSHDEIAGADDANIVDHVGFGTGCFPETASAPAIADGKSIERKKLGQDTDNNAADFKISDEPTPKGTFPKTIINNTTNFTDNMSGAYWHNLTLKWQGSAMNIDFYQVQYRINEGVWTDWLANTTNTTGIFQAPYSLLNNNVYYFRVRAKDLDGNMGDWSPEISVDTVNPLLISEVAFTGTGDSEEQWIELYNRSDQDIDLAGYNIVSGENGRDTMNITLNGTIAAHGYFMVGNFGENQVIGKHYLYLRAPNNRYLDEFHPVNSDWDEAFFTKDGVHYSAERVSMYSFGVFDKNWKLGTGTPGAQNSNDQLYTYYTTSFVENTVLPVSLSPFVFRENVHISKDVTVLIEPGTVVKFYDNQARLIVDGTLDAEGTETENIVFTSFTDDEFGGDTNQDADATAPAPGNWLSLYFSNTSVNSVLEHVRLRYGGSTALNDFGNALWVDHSSVSLKNSILENNKNRALILMVSDSIIDNVQFLNHNVTDFLDQNQARAIYIQGGSPEIKNSRIENSTSGMYITYYYDALTDSVIEALPTVTNNQFVKNSEPVFLGEHSYPSFSGNELSENNINAITFFPRIVKNMELGADMPYYIKSVVTVPENVTLTILPGAKINFSGTFSGLRIDGTLKAIGTPDNQIYFQTYYFDAYTEGPGKWLGLRFTGTSVDSELENVVVSGAGAYWGNPQNFDFYSGIKVEHSAISLRSAVFENNANTGLWLVDSSSIIDGAVFENHQITSIYGLFAEAKGIYVQGGAPEIKNSQFTDNWYGIFIDDPQQDDGTVITATPVMENNQFSGNIREDVHYVHQPVVTSP